MVLVSNITDTKTKVTLENSLKTVTDQMEFNMEGEFLRCYRYIITLKLKNGEKWKYRVTVKKRV
jgi:hypothetical protein